MEKLYPPYISGTIPAFYGTTLVVPFSMNKTVGYNEIDGFVLKVKTINGIEKETAEVGVGSINSNGEIVFELSKKYNTGQYYKIQIAYKSKVGHVVGYYSTVGIVKCTTKPKVSIAYLDSSSINSHLYSYIGTYSQENGDRSEKLYSSRFLILDSEGNILKESSSEILHNASLNDNSYEANEVYNINKDLPDKNTYYIQYIVTTSNGLVVKSDKYRIYQRDLIKSEYDLTVSAINDYDNGTVVLKLSLPDSKTLITGSFVISRAKETDNWEWEEIQYIHFQEDKLSDWAYIDYTAEQGILYKYSIQQYNSNGMYSKRIESDEVYSDFEDAFLYDGVRQLKIRFNPKVSTYKSVILEGKSETIGSKYPFITRNGRVNYKELAISGLISYQMDENENFVSKDELTIDRYLPQSRLSTAADESYIPIVATDLISENMASERIFKNLVLDWLNDGKIKLFKSPAEGNYLVRLMNVALSPTDSLGRMLHTFNCNAYEICEPTLHNFESFGIIPNLEEGRTDESERMKWRTAEVFPIIEKNTSDSKRILIDEGSFYSAYFTDFYPGSIIYINGEEIVIGATGEYIINDEFPIYSIEVNRNCLDSSERDSIYGITGEFGYPLITYSYKQTGIFGFEEVSSFKINDIPLRQFFGAYDNLFDSLTDLKTELNTCYMAKFEKRGYRYVFVESFSESESPAKFYKDIDCETEMEESDWNIAYLYKIRLKRDKYLDVSKESIKDNTLDETDIPEHTEYVVSPSVGHEIYKDKDLFKISFTYDDGTVRDVYLDEIEKYNLEQVDESIIGIKTGIGVISFLSYSVKILNYMFDEMEPAASLLALVNKQKDVVARCSEKTTHVLNETIDGLAEEEKQILKNYTLEEHQQLLNILYKKYLQALEITIEEYNKQNGKVG